jgi:hypothetical protein
MDPPESCSQLLQTPIWTFWWTSSIRLLGGHPATRARRPVAAGSDLLSGITKRETGRDRVMRPDRADSVAGSIAQLATST